jgi:phosphoglycolate phosphatase-like HAD superfamily hydrolase
MRLVLFDIDGTLMRGAGIGTTALKRAFSEVFEINAVNDPRLDDVFIAGSTDPVILRHMAEALELDPARFTDALPGLTETYFRHLRDTVAESETKRTLPGVPELVERLHGHPRVTLALLTGNMERAARIKLEPFDLNRYFAFGGFGGDGPDRTAQALHALRIAESLNGGAYAAKHVIVIGDTVNDVIAARAHGFLAAGVATGFGRTEDMEREGADAVFETLAPEHGFPAWLDARWDLGW